MKTKFDLSTAQVQFSNAMGAASKLTGFPRRQIVMGETGVVLKTCASRTKVASAAKVAQRAQLRVIRSLGLSRGGPVTINAGVKADYGRVFLRKEDSSTGQGHGYRRTHDANFQPLNYHYSNDEWAVISSAIESVKKVVPRARREGALSAGLARGSWVMIADSLGIVLEAVSGGGSLSADQIDKARQSRARGNKQVGNGLSSVEDNISRFVVTVINRLPYGRALGFDHMLSAVMIGRAKYFFTACEKGFKGSLQECFRQFPEWTVRGR